MSQKIPALVAGVVVIQVLAVLAFVLPVHKPEPHGVPLGLVGPPQAAAQLERAHPGAFAVRAYPSVAAAESAIRDREVYGAVVAPGRQVLVASAASPAVAQALRQAAGPRAEVRDVVPLDPDDPRGATLNALFLPLIIASLPAAFLLARLPLRRVALVATLKALAALGGLAVIAVVGPVLGLVPGPYLALAAVAALIVLAMALPTAGLVRLLGAPGFALAAVAFLFIGNAGSGNATAPELLPGFWRAVGPLLPPGAAAPRCATSPTSTAPRSPGRSRSCSPLPSRAARSCWSAVRRRGAPVRPRRPEPACARRRGRSLPRVRRGRALAAACVAALAAAPPAAATTLPPSFTPPCPTYGDQQICSDTVPSWDGSPLDVDLTLPAQGTGPKHPLMIVLHGFGNNKHEWESVNDEGDGADKYHWNSHWFAKHGYYVLAYTARGFRDDGPTDASQPDTPSFSSVGPPNGTIHVKSRDYEIRDTQWLAALVAATFPDVDPGKLAVTGGSYGGGESWMQASQPHWTFPHAQDPTLPVLDLQVAIPKYPWTDVAYSLGPNGHGGGPSRQDIYESSQAPAESDTGGGSPATGNPLGVPKASLITGLFALGSARGVFSTGAADGPENENGPEDIPAWNARIVGAGDPYPDGDPLLQQAGRGLTEMRSAYYQDEGWTSQAGGREVAVFSISGWTDDLFEAVESFREFKYLKRLDRLWPVSVAVADVGHSRAQNRPETWHRLNNQAFQTLQSNINGSHRQQTTVSSEPTICADDPGQPGPTSAHNITATTPEGLSKGTLSITYAGGGHVLTNPPSGGPDPNGPATDPVIGDIIGPAQDCRTSTEPAAGGYTGVSQPLTNHTTYVGLGEVDVHYELTPPATQAQLDARVWDVPPTGPAFLMTRGAYRLDTLNGYDPPVGDLRLPLFGNHWLLAPGHQIRLDLTQVDQPFLRPNNLASSITYGTPKLVLPTREARVEALTGTP